MPIPCWPRDWRIAWNLEPNSSCPNTFSILFCGIPGPLSSTTNSMISFLVSSFETFTLIVGSMRASSHASKELSTASLTAVISDLTGESKPRKCLFFSKNSEMATCFDLRLVSARYLTCLSLRFFSPPQSE